MLYVTSMSTYGGVRNGSVVFHTIRNNPEISSNNNSQQITIGSIVEAEGLKIVCKKNQYVSLKFSNEVVIEILPETSVKINSFKQIQPFAQNHSYERENSESNLSITLIKGKINLISKEQKALSTFDISTSLGKLSIKGKSFILSDDNDSVEIVVIEGMATYNSPNGKKDFVRNKQRGKVSKETINQNFPLAIDRIGMLEEQQYQKELAPCHQVQDSILFEFDANKKLTAKRIIFKEFLLRPTKYNY